MRYKRAMILRQMGWVFLIFMQTVSAFEFNWELIQDKLKEPLPEWMEAQIQEDLEPFQNGFTSTDIETTIKDVYKIPSGGRSGFVRYRIKDNKITTTSPSEKSDDARVAHVVEVLQDLAQHLVLPNVDFLAALWDSYDNPIFLEKTRCPVFTICKTKGSRGGVLFPEFRHFSYRRRLCNDISSTSDKSPWELKTPKAFWRGMSSGFHYTLYEWDSRPRSRLVIFAHEYPDLADAAITSPYSLNDEIKKIMETYGMFQSWSYPSDFVHFKYLVSIDGNTFASNLWWQLLSNSAVLKNESEYIEWFYKGIYPYVHYVPYELDLSDFKEKILWLKEHDQEARAIAEQGSAFAKKHLTNEVLAVYFYRLLQAYAKIHPFEE